MIRKRKSSSGKVRYGVQIRQGDKKLWLGTFDTIADARHVEAQARLGRRGRQMRSDEFARFWLEGYRERVKASTFDTAETALKGFIEDFRDVPLARLDPITAEKWARPNRWRVPIVVTLLNAAVDAGLIERNPFARLSHKGEGRKRIVPLTGPELDELADAALTVHGSYGPMMRSLLLFLAYTGMRPGEAFALEWSDLDFNRMRIRIERRIYKGSVDLPKSNRARLIVLPPPGRDALLGLSREGSSLVFRAKRGGKLSQATLSGYWAPVVAAFGRKLTPYELRHFAAHYLYVQLGLPARVVAVQLGHDGPKLVEQLYGHGDVGALEEIDQAFGANVVPLRRAEGG